MSNSIESYSADIFSRAVGKKNIRLQRDFLYVVDVFKESLEDEEKNERDIAIYADLNEAVEEYNKFESFSKTYELVDHVDTTVILYQCYWDRSKKALNKLLEMRKCVIESKKG